MLKSSSGLEPNIAVMPRKNVDQTVRIIPSVEKKVLMCQLNKKQSDQPIQEAGE